MSTTFPGTTIEVPKLEEGSSKLLFDGIFATGGITLSQVSIMTGLEPYLIQNWVKRGFLTSPVGRVYSKEQFARIVIINMLRDVLQIDKICSLIHVIAGVPTDKSDDLISDDELYHRYVNLLASNELNISDKQAVISAAEKASEDFAEPVPGARKQLVRILTAMVYAHAATHFASLSDEIISTLQ